MENIRLFTSESVTEGHPDKVCDRIADAVLDAYLKQDPLSRVALEVCCKGEHMYLLGEITSRGSVDLPAVARRVIGDIGYTSPDLGFDDKSAEIVCNIEKQSPDIAMGVDSSVEEKEGERDKYGRIGAGDQGMMFGYACSETPELMPLAISLAHKLTRRLTFVRKEGILPFLRPDGKAQVTVRYVGGKPAGIDTVVVSTQHDPGVEMEDLRVAVKREVIDAVIPAEMMDEGTKLYINPTGRFVLGGPAGDSGVTGRKIIVDTYGGYCPHGGGAFSGKDSTKVDRSACYMARYICKNVVAAGLAERCQMQVAYAIGVARPVSVTVDTFGTGQVADAELARAVQVVFDLRPAAIIDKLGLAAPIYENTSDYGHFGREGFSWERTDMTEKLKEALRR
ncbi:MAG TPA: methionine adenosyltransferase [Candidatus Caccalectryoclostridium excrementigallinarum]|uniref:S-adenosylmethionine synthase n=1 Tax=Candidatus Caccalectryoclostridium excrementigallinarum TaxID=2840710 RepID=A0A9D1SKA6_9FIRM|nr:methionine adenosyltransferase [Candidatus Caccalectryoclostridium excrementigallinarum]